MTKASHVRAKRIAPLANLPLFHRLAGRAAIVIGSSEGALWKAELLAAAGAKVRLLLGEGTELASPQGGIEMAGAGPIEAFARNWAAADLAGAALVVADLADEVEARRLVDSAHAAGALVNLIDRPELGDAQFGVIVNRSPLVLAISTDGGSPALGQFIRARLEALLPRALGVWSAAAKSWRPRVLHWFASFAERRAFWQRFAARAWAAGDRQPERADLVSLLAFAPETSAGGRVTLVGAGPGDPDLLTIKALQALQRATVILYDDLVAPEILELARREARRVPVGKRGYRASFGQDEICRQLVSLAQAGEQVVRLKGGDPLIFGRAAEEIEACREAGVAVSIIPGVSAAQGAAAALGLSLTRRGDARRLQFVTGHGAYGGLPADLDWPAIADAKATTAIYMPRRTLGEFARQAMAHGLAPATPALAIASATLPAQRHVAATLADIAKRMAALPKKAPVLVILGEVARLSSSRPVMAEAA
jgi:uroporphyrin-III C-methyltransferase / precorrin-2 dehydrogenase / sirohydrochlorin ferrochelatase